MFLRVASLSGRYGKLSPLLFADLTWDFPAESVTAVMGPSGSGKSTLLNILGKIHKSYEGRVNLLDSNEAPVKLTRSSFSWVLQTNTVLSGRSAVDNASLGLVAEGFGHKAARDLARTALSDLGLGERMHASVGELSGGEVQRVTVARCLLQNSPVILADEPTGQLDAESTGLVCESLVAAARRGKVVIIATHDQAVADRSDHVLNLGQHRPL